jgi:hypothetical protein
MLEEKKLILFYISDLTKPDIFQTELKHIDALILHDDGVTLSVLISSELYQNYSQHYELKGS